MFGLHHIKGNTYYYKAFTNVGVCRVSENEVVLIDSCDHKRMVRGLDKILEEKGWRVKTIINTHCHSDHICGNRYFSEKYNCKILSTKLEAMFIEYPDLESKFYYSGIDTNKKLNPFFQVEPSKADVITEDNIPDGFEIIPLDGHSFEMIGVRTADGVVFLADSVLSEKTVDEYKLPFFHNVNKSIETLKKIEKMKGDIYLPSHSDLTDDISSLCQHNIEGMENVKQTVLEICDGKSFDEMFTCLAEKMQLKLKTDKYPMYSVMLRNYLQSLVEDKKICARLENNKFIYHTI